MKSTVLLIALLLGGCATTGGIKVDLKCNNDLDCRTSVSLVS